MKVATRVILVRRISNQQPPIADVEHPFAFSPIDIAECRMMFQIGDRLLLIAN